MAEATIDEREQLGNEPSQFEDAQVIENPKVPTFQ